MFQFPLHVVDILPMITAFKIEVLYKQLLVKNIQYYMKTQVN